MLVQRYCVCYAEVSSLVRHADLRLYGRWQRKPFQTSVESTPMLVDIFGVVSCALEVLRFRFAPSCLRRFINATYALAAVTVKR